MEQQRNSETSREVAATQVSPVAGIWLCPNCGRRIQVVTESEVPKSQAFVCVCGHNMEPGDEHNVVADGDQGEDQSPVVDD